MVHPWTMETTIRKELTNLGFDWTGDHSILWSQTDDATSAGWSRKRQTPLEISDEHPILDHRWKANSGSPECPAIVAQDARAIYFPSFRDGYCRLARVYRDVQLYITEGVPLPYTGV